MFKLLVILFLFPLFSQASIAIEPYVGGGLAYFGEMNSGFSFGSRLGYKKWGFTTGVDVSYSQFHVFNLTQETTRKVCNETQDKIGIAKVNIPFCDSDAEQDLTSVYNIISAGPSLSFGLPLILDAYASLTWSWVDKQISNIEKAFPMTGPGAKVGVSYLSLPFLQINIELQALILSCVNMDEKCEEQNNILNPVIMGHAYISVPISTGLL